MWVEDLVVLSTDIEAMYPSLYMSSYYMDDGNWAAKALPPGCRLVEGKLEIVQSEVENDC